MRLLRALVLLILLPGLLVPGGLGFRICLCTGSEACCAPEAAETDCCAPAKPVASCCRSSPASESPGPVVNAEPTCACVDVGTPPQPPSMTPGLVHVDFAPVHEVAVAQLAWTAPRALSAGIEATARPPPSAIAPRNQRLLL